MKITAFNGSPKGGGSRTNMMVEAFFEGAASAGAEVENVLLVKKKIKHCLGCFHCFIKTPGQCIHKDDMKELLDMFVNSDVVLFATPLYIDNVSGIMKNFMDRLIPIVMPHLETDEHGEIRHVKRFDRYPGLAVISNCGFPEQSQFQVLQLLFRRIARNLHTDVAAEIYRGGGMILGHEAAPLADIHNRYMALVRKAGEEFGANGGISEETAAELDRPLVPAEMYMTQANARWDVMIEEAEQDER